MKVLLVFLVVLAGAGIPMQVAMNSRLKDSLQSPPLAVAIAFAVGSLFMVFLTLSGLLGRGDLSKATEVPWWAWLGGLFSTAAVLISIIAKDQAGTAAIIAGTVFGQLVAAMAIDHFGWLGVEKEPINPWKVTGAVLLFAGALLMGKK